MSKDRIQQHTSEFSWKLKFNINQSNKSAVSGQPDLHINKTKKYVFFFHKQVTFQDENVLWDFTEIIQCIHLFIKFFVCFEERDYETNDIFLLHGLYLCSISTFGEKLEKSCWYQPVESNSGKVKQAYVGNHKKEKKKSSGTQGTETIG